MEIFHTIIYQPLYNALVFFYNVIPGQDFGIAIIIVTLLIKVVLYPLSKKQIESQKRIQEIQPQVKELQKKYKDNKEKQMKEMMQLYKDKKTNPFSGCLPLIVQLIFLIAFYRILINFSTDLNVNANDLYGFISNPGKINNIFIGLVDLAKPSIPLAIMAAIAQYFQTKMMMFNKNKNKSEEEKTKETKDKKEAKDKGKPEEPDFGQIMNKQMVYIGPFLTLFIGIKFGAGLALYWLVSTLFMLGQQIYIMKFEPQDIKKENKE